MAHRLRVMRKPRRAAVPREPDWPLVRLFTVLERTFEGFEHDNIPVQQVFAVGVPLHLPSNVSQRHGLEMETGGDTRVSTRGVP
jgi:hypothetical protein